MIIDISSDQIFVESKYTGYVYKVYKIKIERNKIIEYFINNCYADCWHDGFKWVKVKNFYSMYKKNYLPCCYNNCEMRCYYGK